MTPRLHLVVFGGEPNDPTCGDSAPARRLRVAGACSARVAGAPAAPGAAEKPGG